MKAVGCCSSSSTTSFHCRLLTFEGVTICSGRKDARRFMKTTDWLTKYLDFLEKRLSLLFHWNWNSYDDDGSLTMCVCFFMFLVGRGVVDDDITSKLSISFTFSVNFKLLVSHSSEWFHSIHRILSLDAWKPWLIRRGIHWFIRFFGNWE